MKVLFASGIPAQKCESLKKTKTLNFNQPYKDEFTAEKNEKKDKKDKEPFYKRIKTVAAAVISSVLTAVCVVLCLGKHNRFLSSENDELTKEKDDLKKSNEDLKNALDNIILPENIEESTKKEIESLNETELSYSPVDLDFVENKNNDEQQENSESATILPQKYEKTSHRKDAKNLKHPLFINGKSYHFAFPESSEIKLTRVHTDITPIEETLTTISESYADSLKWNNDKIARDLLQNFYDGHGQTLDGVKIDMVPTNGGKYKVKVQGNSTFSPDKAILLGESSKKSDSKAAGNYGEGLKMVVLKLLKDKGAENIKIASDNWQVNWSLKDSGLGKRVLAYNLKKSEPVDGNYIEFETDNKKFIESLINSYDRFYHYNNPDFKCPDFENDSVSIKLFDNENEKGKFYITGQAFEVDGEYESLKGMSINVKNKPPMKYGYEFIFDPSRDRVSLNEDNLRALGKWVASPDNMSKEDAIKLIHSLEEYWDDGTIYGCFKHMTKGSSFISGLFDGCASRRDLNIKFPENRVADAFGVSVDLAEMYKKAGYRICSTNFQYCGMRSIKELIADARRHKPVEPSESEKNKILILKKAIQLLSPVLGKNDFFTKEELDTRIYIFDNDSGSENEAYKDVGGEAIIKDGHVKGFWLEKDYLDNIDFSSALGTSLHELTHKFGGDSSAVFSYKLTDVLQKVFTAVDENPNLATQLKVLEKAWNAQ